MKIKSFFKCLPLIALSYLFVTSCSDNLETTSETEIQAYVEDNVSDMQREARCGKRGCYEFVFPIDIILPDSSIVSVESYEDMRATIKDFRVNNPDVEGRTQLSYPLDIMTDDGELITVESKEELKEAIKDCIVSWAKDHPRLNNSCYRLAFPFTLEFPNGDTVSVENKSELKSIIREYRKNNRGKGQGRWKHPKITFPFTIYLKDSQEEVLVENAEQLAAIKEECREG